MTLFEAEKNKVMRVTGINGNDHFKHRLQGFGIIPGTPITRIRNGLGIRLYDVMNSFIAIRNEDAKNINVAHLNE